MTETTLVPKLSHSRTAELWGCNRNVQGFHVFDIPVMLHAMVLMVDVQMLLGGPPACLIKVEGGGFKFFDTRRRFSEDINP